MIAEKLRIDPDFVEWEQLDADTQAATALVYVCHVGADGSMLDRYRIKWWSEFLPARVTLSARVSADLAEFTSELCKRLRGQIGNWQDSEAHRELWRALITLPAERQRKILDILETQATVCTTLVRADLDLKWRRRQANGQKTEVGNSGGDGSGSNGASLFATAGSDVPGSAG